MPPAVRLLSQADAGRLVNTDALECATKERMAVQLEDGSLLYPVPKDTENAEDLFEEED